MTYKTILRYKQPQNYENLPFPRGFVSIWEKGVTRVQCLRSCANCGCSKLLTLQVKYIIMVWPAQEVAALNAARIAGKPDADIRELVTKLEAARKAAA